MRTFRSALMIAAGLFLSLDVQPALAHHSYAAFDKDHVVSVQGTVRRWDWTNPHSFLYVTVARPGQAATDWEIESASPSLLRRIGFTATSMKPGDRVTVRIYPHRTRPNMGSLVAVDLPGGRTLVMSLLDPKAR